MLKSYGRGTACSDRCPRCSPVLDSAYSRWPRRFRCLRAAAAADFGSPGGWQKLSIAKWRRLQSFVDGELAAGRMRAPSFLIQRHGQAGLSAMFRQRKCRDAGRRDDTGHDIPDHSVTKTITSFAR